MCTVIFEVLPKPLTGVRVLAVRDELPDRPWDPPGKWWPKTHPDVVGVRDRKAGGAWLAADSSSLSVILNRAENVAKIVPENQLPLDSRGSIVLESVAGKQVAKKPHTESFNLVEINDTAVQITYWDGIATKQTVLKSGVHMIAHSMVDDVKSARISKWLPEFQKIASAPVQSWQEEWLKVLVRSTKYGPHDDRAIIRDNTSHGYPTKSLLVCAAQIDQTGVQLESAVLKEAGHWHDESFSEVKI